MLGEVLPDDLLKLVRLYFFPQPPGDPNGKWLTQEEVTEGGGVGDFRNVIVGALGRIYRRHKFGPDAMENLKLDHFLYYSLVKFNKKTIKEISTSSAEEFVKICGFRSNFSLLTSLIPAFISGWEPPQVIFPEEDSPQKSAKRLLDR